jgi:hypothetical protein
LKKKIAETDYYKLILRECFSQDNRKCLNYMMGQAYNDQKLEQLEQLEINSCKVGPVNVFGQICSRLATSKGLLQLGVGEISALADPGCMEKLIGDWRTLRLNYLDWSGN